MGGWIISGGEPEAANIEELAAVEYGAAADMEECLGELAHQGHGGARGAATITLLLALVPLVGDRVLLDPAMDGEP